MSEAGSSDRSHPAGSRSGVVDWWFRDRTTGRIVIAQAPNPALWVFIVTWVARAAVDPAGGVRTALALVGGAALVWWSGDEVLRGVNPWRRVLGATVLVGWLATVAFASLR